ncbi:Trp family transcriptional regulator [Desulfogranum mediterraneum]|uniref:Trp family transcriptional regulator n=1 Tax=Desulfogranum mediterraneum TaxID=160661 RepID=UPI00041441B0|nr:Trp family transcriptional regulator [Desulfogranum mediterraneum]
MESSKELIELLTAIDHSGEMGRFLGEILTPKEINDLALRWQLLRELHQGKTQRAIAASHHISLCKITRGAKILKDKESTTLHLLEKYYGSQKER